MLEDRPNGICESFTRVVGGRKIKLFEFDVFLIFLLCYLRIYVKWI